MRVVTSVAMTEQLTIVIVDKSPLIRSGLAEIINRDGRYAVAQTLATGGEFIELVHTGLAVVGIIGWSLPDMTGGDVLVQLKDAANKPRLIIYTGESISNVLRPSIKSGAWGFMSKSDEPEVLLETISSVMHGRLSFPYVDLDKLARNPFEELTNREKELLAALANGWTNLQIAARIGISRNTVKYHLKNLYDKLDVSNRAMAVALFVKESGTRYTQ